MIAVFTLIPLLFSALIAFTNYSSPDHIPPKNLVDWVGLENFRTMFSRNLGGNRPKAFGRVAVWTITWAVLSTLSCFFVGFMFAVILQDKRIAIPRFFRTIFILPYAIPQMLSLFVWANLLNGTFGPINRTLQYLQLISQNIPWLSNPLLAKLSLVLVNIWIGFPYSMILTTSAMTAISQAQYEASEIDGASKWIQFRHITQVLLVLYPLAFTVSASFSQSNSLAATSILPFRQKLSLYQYARLFKQTNYFHWYLNTLIIASTNTIITVSVCSLCGYIFSRFMFPFKKPVMASMIILQMFPSFIGMIATYVILWKLNALNTLWGLVLVYATGSIPFNSWLMKGYFDTVPRDISEAAYIDGATPFGAFIQVVVPAAKPQIVFLALTSFTGPWMDFIFPRLILRSDDKKTLAVGLYEMINGRAADHFTMFAAGSLLVAIPFTILFVLGQKALLQSLAGTGGKE